MTPIDTTITQELGALVATICCNHGSKTFKYAKQVIFLDVGAEVVTGSTRMKTGTAQKLVLKLVTTASMIRYGKVFQNLMVDLKPVNRKLVERSKRLIRQATGCTSGIGAQAENRNSDGPAQGERRGGNAP